MASGLYSYKHELNCTINIYYLNDVSDTVSTTALNVYINDIHNNFKRYNNKIFEGLTINIWHPERTDIPHTTRKCDIKTGICSEDLQIAEYAGLTWAWKSRIDINGRFTKDIFELAQILSHEVGHYIDYLSDLNANDDNIIQYEWIKIRVNDNTPTTNAGELMAEDIRFLLGCRMAQGYPRGDYTPANKVRGLRDMLLIWYPVNEHVKKQKSEGGKIYQSTVSYKYSDTDFNYFGVQYCVQKIINNSVQKIWYWCDRNSLYRWSYINNSWKWVVEKSY